MQTKTNNMILKILHIKHSSIEYNYKIFTAVVCKEKGKEKIATKERITCVGNFRSLQPGDYYKMTLIKHEHKIYGEQYNVLYQERIEPGTIEEIKKFLISRGKGIGKTKAEKIVDRYGLETINEIINNPKALDFLKIKEETIKIIRQDLLDNRTFEKLLAFLRQYSINPEYSNLLFLKYEYPVVSKISEDPYSPFLSGIWDFEVSEDLYYKLNLPKNSKRRVLPLVLNAIKWDSINGGNLYIDEIEIPNIVDKFLHSIKSPLTKEVIFTADEYSYALATLEQNNFIKRDCSIDDKVSIYLNKNFKSENIIPVELKRLFFNPKSTYFSKNEIDLFLAKYQKANNFTLAEKQKEAVMTAITSPISIITGGPGSGKTHTIKTIISCIKSINKSTTISICAPTGKAAIRAEEMSGLPATTIHRLLRLNDKKNGPMDREELDSDFVIADEYSMVDAFICSKLFQAISSHTRVIIVGDYDQLPSVDPGLVLRDFIHSNLIPTVKLNQLFRQQKESKIAINSRRIINAKAGDVPHIDFSQNRNEDFYFMKADSISSIKKQLKKTIPLLHKKYNLKIEDIQILTPIKNNGLGTNELNMEFQEIYHPSIKTPTIEIRGKEFRLGDKVIHTKNNIEKDTYNGEVGKIIAMDFLPDNAFTVEYSNNKHVIYSEKMAHEELELAYALTIHKSQGSEFPVVIIPIHHTLLTGFNKHTLFTAITRAKRMVIFVGDMDTLNKAIANQQRLGDRRSHLIERMHKEFKK